MSHDLGIAFSCPTAYTGEDILSTIQEMPERQKFAFAYTIGTLANLAAGLLDGEDIKSRPRRSHIVCRFRADTEHRRHH